jgi:hypothetical protein
VGEVSAATRRRDPQHDTTLAADATTTQSKTPAAKPEWTPYLRPSFTQDAVINDAIATAARLHASAPPVGLADPKLYTDEVLDQEIHRLKTRIENAPAHKLAPERELLDLLEKEQLRRAVPPPMADAGTLNTREELESAIGAHAKYLDRFGGRLADSVRTQRQNYLDGLRAKLDFVIGDERVCSEARPTPVAPHLLPGGAKSIAITADDVIAALKQAGATLTPQQETTVRSSFERWRRDECWQTGSDPTRFAPSGNYKELGRIPASEAADKRARMCLEMIESMRNSPVAAASFMMSIAHGDTIESAHTRMAAALNVSSLALPSRNATPSIVKGSVQSATLDPFNKSIGRYQVKPMLPVYGKNPAARKLGEHEPMNKVFPGQQVKYLSAKERAGYKLEVREVEINGVKEKRIVDANGKLFNTDSATNIDGQPAHAIFVMNSSGELFASLHQKSGEFHHSSLAAGQAVAAAGEMKVVDGKLISISNRSGHYLPDHTYTEQVLHCLRSQGLDVSAAKVVVISKEQPK